MRSSIFALAASSGLVSAHFQLDYPAARGFDEDILGTFPCGGQDTVSSNRTTWPISNGSIALTMGHIDANVEVLIGLGNDVRSEFNTILRPTFEETGLGAFCMTGITIPDSLNITDGTNATIQVITNGDPNGGLYNCADITFSSTAPAPASGVCTNNTGVTASTTTIDLNANSSTVSGSTTSSSASSTATTGTASSLQMGLGGLLVAGVAAFAVVLQS